MPPKVSIVTASYNGEKYLEQSVSSMLNQTFDDFEFIIVDDGSTDHTFETLQKIGDPRVRIIRQSNQGQTNALITGIEQAQGELIARIDQDDYSLPNRLMRQVKFMDTHPKVVICGSRFQESYDENLISQRVKFVRTNAEAKKIISYYNPFAHSALMFRRNDYLKIAGYDSSFLIAMDYDLLIRFMEIGEVYNIDEVLTVVRIYNDSTSMKKNRRKTLEGIKIRYRAYFKFGGNPLLVGYFFLKSLIGLIMPRWIKNSLLLKINTANECQNSLVY